jgi:hypothetical protein
VQPKVVFASFDGTGSSASFFPTLKIISDAGEVVGIFPTPEIVAAGESADVSWFRGVGSQISTTEGTAGVIVETLYLDMTVGTATAATVLAAGVPYVITMQGTWIFYDHPLDVGTPEPTAMFPTPSGGRVSTQVGLDAETCFAKFSGASGPGIGNQSLIKTNLGSGATHIAPVGGPYTTPVNGHFYRYQVTGQGSAPVFTFFDTVYPDNYGKIQITIQSFGGSSGAGGGSLMPDPTRQPDGAWIRTASGVATWDATPQVAETDMTLSDVTTQNVGITKHGFAPKSPNDATKYLDGTGAYSVPPGSAAVSSVFGRSGAVVAVNGDYEGVVASALTGATAATRYVGGTTSGAPASGTFAKGDFVIDQTAVVWVCTVAGTPGTWTNTANSSTAGVTTWNTRAGAVTLAAADVEALFTASGQVFQGTGSGTGTLKNPPGFEISYTALTSTVNVTSLTEASGTTLISPGAITFDGGAVMCELFGLFTTPNGLTCTVRASLFEGSTQIARLCTIFVGSSSGNNQIIANLMGSLRFTPSVGSHTYTVTGATNSTTGTPAFGGTAGGTAGDPPAYLRFTKV